MKILGMLICLICTHANFLSAFCTPWTSDLNLLPYGEWIYENYPELPAASIKKCYAQSFMWNGGESITPYSNSRFTKMPLQQIIMCKMLSEKPKWGPKQESIQEYYDLHEETQFDRNLCSIATFLMGVIVHGGVAQDDLEERLNLFDVRKLLSEGPKKNSILSPKAQQLLYDSLSDLPQIFDIHLHNLGYDEGNFVHEKMAAQRKASYRNYFAFTGLRYASGMSTVMGSTHEARRRMHLYAGHFPKLKGMILPIHKAFFSNGKPDWNATGLFLKNRSALVTAASFVNPYGDSDLLPSVSVHPFDPHWKEKLYSAYQKGILLVKWMPPQSIPPDAEQLDEFYLTLKALKMILIAHAGTEHAIPPDVTKPEWDDWGNPLRFRRALQLGANVILAHCGHQDLLPDLDDPHMTKVPGYELFIRLAREAHLKNETGEWSGLLYGDLAAVTTHYGPDFIKVLLHLTGEKGIRLIYGSDFPYTNLIQPNRDAYDLCASSEILDAAFVEPLKEIRNWNPLLANYVFTRNLEMKLSNGKKMRFQACTFTGDFPDAPLRLIDKEKWELYKQQLQS